MKRLFTLYLKPGFGVRAIAIVFLAMWQFASEAQTILTEGFESATFPPTGWTRTTSNATYPWARVVSNTGNPAPAAHSGSYMARYNSFSAPSGATAELITPALNFSGANQVAVSFWMYRDPAYLNYLNERVEVFVNTSAASG